MNSAKFTKSTCKNQSYLYTVTMSNPERKLRKQFYLQIASKTVRYLEIKPLGYKTM